MGAHDAIQTEFLVLRKTPYAESSLVLAGLSPEHGQLHFLVRGGRRIERRGPTPPDLFRVLAVEYTAGRSDLHTWRQADMVADWGALARSPTAYAAACWLAAFTLGNTLPHAPCPRYCHALHIALQRLADSATASNATPYIGSIAVVGACLVYLDESGLLPTYDDNPDDCRRRDRLVAMGEGIADPPSLDENEWRALHQWTLALLQHAELRLPADPRP